MPQPGMDYDRGFHEDQWFCEQLSYYDQREYYDEGYPTNDRRYYEDNPGFQRNPSPPRNHSYSRHDLRHQLSSRTRGRAGPHFRSRGRGSGPSQSSAPDRKAKSLHSHQENSDDYRSAPPVVAKRDRSPNGREAQPPARSGSNTTSRGFSPDKDKGFTHQQAQKKRLDHAAFRKDRPNTSRRARTRRQGRRKTALKQAEKRNRTGLNGGRLSASTCPDKPTVGTSHAPSSSVEEAPHSSGSSKDKTPASPAETEEVAAASVEPKPTPEDDFKARRLMAIKAKALEIEKHYRQDCETFSTVVKMLVAKEPSLDNLLQAPLDKNLSEIKQHCLDDLRHFVKELDEILARGAEPDHDSHQTSLPTHIIEEDFSKLCSTNPTCTDGKQEDERQPENTGHSASALVGSQGGGEKSGNVEDSTLVSDTCSPGIQEVLASPGTEKHHSEPIELQPKSLPVPAQQCPKKGDEKRLQLYNRQGVKLKTEYLLNPQLWQDIGYARPGWVPFYRPFRHLGEWYWEHKANSAVVSSTTPPYVKDGQKVPCGVICYMNEEGPWCEVWSENESTVCLLAVNHLQPRSHL